MNEYEHLKKLVEEVADDVAKAQGGNKAAGTRVRKKMQDIKSAAQEVRKKVLEGRDGEGGAADPGGATTGRILPTGAVRQSLDVPGLGAIEASLFLRGR